MVYLLLAIVCSTLNHLLFKIFARRRVDLLHAIVANYAVCVGIGSCAAVAPGTYSSVLTAYQPWFPWSVVQGGVLVLCFFLIGRTTETHGVVIASLASRLSVAIPTFAAFLLYADLVTPLKLVGIMVALLALYLSGGSSAPSGQLRRAAQILPITLFFAYGGYATLLKFVQDRYLGGTSYHTYVMSAFISALLISSAVLLWRRLRRRQPSAWRSLAWGLVLGCSNYGAIYFLIRALGVPGWQSSQLFPTLSIAVLVLSTLGAWAIFGERLQRRMLVALALGAGAIVLLNI